jgi:hypothetical protein
MTRIAVAALALLLPALWPVADAAEPAAAAPIPVRVRILKGSRQGPASLDPKLAVMKQQLSKLAYQRWEQLSERDYEMAVKQTIFTDLPYGDHLALTVEASTGKTVTFEVALAQRNTQSRLTIEKGQRIVHQVSGEKNGVAYFVSVHAWPTGP